MAGMTKILLSPLMSYAVGGLVLILAVHPLLLSELELSGETAAAMGDERRSAIRGTQICNAQVRNT
jgi:hypothetical protein